MKFMLKIKNLTKNYGDKKAVDNLSLEINGGEIYGFIGPNGAGKTTTIKSLVGILKFDEGEITLGETDIKKDPLSFKRKIAYIPDNPDLYDYMTGNQYLNFIADIFNVPSGERKQKIENYANKFAIYGDLNSALSSYSHGMKQKIAIISAWIHNPELIVMDEPFVGLDPESSHKLKEMMREHCDNGGMIFFSTHVLEVAERLCDKVAIIKNGKLIKSGTVEEVKGDKTLETAFLEMEN